MKLSTKLSEGMRNATYFIFSYNLISPTPRLYSLIIDSYKGPFKNLANDDPSTDPSIQKVLTGYPTERDSFASLSILHFIKCFSSGHYPTASCQPQSFPQGASSLSCDRHHVLSSLDSPWELDHDRYLTDFQIPTNAERICHRNLKDSL